jgi:GNAT superfamily N-acetyltransferase
MSSSPETATRPVEGEAGVEVWRLAQRPELGEQIDALHEGAWDAFLDGAPWDHWDALFDVFADFQVVLCDPHEVVVGFGHTVPFAWDGTVADLPPLLDEVIERALEDRERARPMTALCALAAVVAPGQQRRGLSTLLVRQMRALAAEHGADALVVPVGPTLKHRYPLTPMERYMHWKRPEGSPFDPWIRVHWKLGAELLGVAPITAISTGSVADWEKWTGMSFPETGRYVVPGALQPVEIDRERDLGRYEDPGVWMRHAVPRADSDAAHSGCGVPRVKETPRP